jgi:hypothetical protein
MRTIAINPVKRKRTKMAARKKATRKAPARKNPTRKANPVRARRKNPKAGLSPAEVKDLGTAAIGGAAAGAVTSYLESNKPTFLAQVPTEAVSIAAGLAIAMFGKTPAMKNVSRGMVAYGAGALAQRYVGAAPGAAAQTGALVFSNPGHAMGNPGHVMSNPGIHMNPGHYNDEIHVGGLVFSLED